MSLKIKITSAIMVIVMIMSLLVAGVLAKPSEVIDLSGGIIFKATNVHAQVSGEVTGSKESEAETDKVLNLQTLTFKANTTDEEKSQLEEGLAKWQDCNLEFQSSSQDISILVTIQNLAVDRPLYASIKPTETISSEIESEMFIVPDSTTLTGEPYDGTTFALQKQDNTKNDDVIYIRINLALTDESAEDLKWGIDVSLLNELESLIQYDETDNYYYLEMGTYNGKPVRWRYIADASNGIENATQFVATANNKPEEISGKKGLFILESELFTSADLANNAMMLYTNDYYNSGDIYYNKAEGYTDVLANDYAASEIRAYLNGENNVAGNSVGSILQTIKINKINALYSKIEKRSLTDLYSKINDNGTSLAVPSQFNSIKDTQTDAFWTMSYQEAYRILGGNSTSSSSLIWHTEASEIASGNDGTYYWLRSPNPTVTYGVYAVLNNGSINGRGVKAPTVASRPAFIFNF